MMSSKISKLLVISFLGFLTLPLLSCKNVVANGDLEIVVIPNQTQAIPAPATTKGCDGLTDIAGAYIIFPTFQYTWKGANALQIELISIRFQSSYLTGDGTFTKIIAGTELLQALGLAPFRPATGVLNQASCGIRVGGIGMNTGVNFASVSGYLKVLATEIHSDGTVNSITSEVPISFEYEAF